MSKASRRARLPTEANTTFTVPSLSQKLLPGTCYFRCTNSRLPDGQSRHFSAARPSPQALQAQCTARTGVTVEITFCSRDTNRCNRLPPSGHRPACSRRRDCPSRAASSSCPPRSHPHGTRATHSTLYFLRNTNPGRLLGSVPTIKKPPFRVVALIFAQKMPRQPNNKTI